MKRKRRRAVRRTRFLTIDGEVHLVVHRRPNGVVTIRLRGPQRAEVLRALDDAQYDVTAQRRRDDGEGGLRQRRGLCDARSRTSGRPEPA